MRNFDFYTPSTLDEAAQALAEYGDSGCIIAGGTALMLAMRQRLLEPQCLISLAKVQALKGIDWDAEKGLRIGALSLHSEVAESKDIQEHYPMFANLAQRLANPQVRNQGTLGGNLCYADPATDPPTGLLALNASVVLHSVRGTRTLPLTEFLVDYYATAIEPDELLVEVLLPPPGRFSNGRYARFLKTAAEHRPLTSVAVVADIQDRFCRSVRISVGATTPIPQRLSKVEEFLADKEMNGATVREAAEMVAHDIECLDDSRGSEWYRRRITQVVTQRSLAEVFGIDMDAGETV